MKIRTITTGISLQSPQDAEKIKQAAEFNQQAKDIFTQQGYEVQTTRIATNSWEEYLQGLSQKEILSQIQRLEEICQNLNLSFFNIGYANQPENIALIPEINKQTSVIYCSSKIGDRATEINLENALESARVIKRISQDSENGYGNFRFCAWANCKPGIPFFPTSYHQGDTAFAIGLECCDLVTQAFSQADDIPTAEAKLKILLEMELKQVTNIAEIISDKFAINFLGIDTSLAPSLDKNNSIAFAYEKLMQGKFGQPGTLAISGMLTRVLKNVSVKICGYSGLMLPVCEDVGLATRANEKTYDITNLLLYSAVCGCGLDTVPIPGDISIEKIAAILIDMATLAIKLDKPLSARLFPIPGKKAGEMTAFNSPYLVDCQIFAVD
ncbi:MULTISPECIES: DUF711 family protein [Calothrix]|uniref:DUF711 family protein n=2 Tax=Calothrix TaxID=1186 RepID=A0ABR8A5T2_9CYAN|nr:MULTISPECIES: DUF711 family protein [Calothrix]MBD2195347.1 DUF711 family protein [Calothrix parietina FACHB-288]MBD2223946.1 DUF711 family protein [Calothrix anomala FACHB-343]